MVNELLVKKAIMAAASKALDYKKKNPDAMDDEAIGHVVMNANNILREVSW